MMVDVANFLVCAFLVPVNHSRVRTLAGFCTNAAHLELCRVQLKRVDCLYRRMNRGFDKSVAWTLER